MFEHSVKVPRHFKIAANIVKKVSEEGGSVKTLLYDQKLKHFRINVLYALINETIKHAVDIESMFQNTGILVNEPRLDPWLARVIAAELIYGKKSLPGQSKPEQTILTYKDRFEKLTPEVHDEHKSKVVRRPRYVRINTNLLATSDAIRAFQDEGYKFIRCTSGSYNDYLQQIQDLTEYDFTQDYHVKTIFVFSPGTKLHDHDLYLENKIILQDKATALAVHLLAAPAGSVVLDMCAAPGMKTTQLAAYLRNQGKIYAVERNEKRYETLCQYVEATGSKCVQTFNKDSLEIKRGDLDDVEYILLDPSCSGSGMELSVHNYIDDSRLARLTSLQEKFLKHAMNSFPNAKRIVYSTCSILPEENERVVTNIVKASRARWRVMDVKKLLKDQWNNFGSGMYGSMGTRCIYAKPDNDFTVGFFVAVLDRDMKGNEKIEQIENKADDHNKLNQVTQDRSKQQDEKISSINLEGEKQTPKKNRNKMHNDNESNNIAHINPEKLSKEKSSSLSDENNITKSTKKNRMKVNEISLINEDSYNETGNRDIKISAEIPEVSISKKKKHKSKLKDKEAMTQICENAENRNSQEMLQYETMQEHSDDINNYATNNKNKRRGFDVTENNISFENNDGMEMSKKKKKKYKERAIKSNEVNSETAIDISLEISENTDTPETVISSNGDNLEITKKKKKKSKHRENDSLKNATVESDQTLEDKNHDHNMKKTEQKVHENFGCPIKLVSALDDSGEGITKPKKKKKDREQRNSDNLDPLNESTIIIEENRKKKKDLGGTEVDEGSELRDALPKKKKKKLE